MCSVRQTFAGKLCFLVALVALGGGAEPLNWQYRGFSVPYESSLTIHLPPGFDRHYVLGIKAEPESSGRQKRSQFIVGEVQFQGGTPTNRIVSSIENLDPALAEITNGSFEVRDSGLKARSLAILGHATVGSRVSVFSGRTQLLSAAVGFDGLLVSDGALIGKPVLGMQSVMMQLVRGSALVKNDGTPKRLSNGRYFVSLQGLRENLDIYKAPSSAIQSLASCCDRVVRLRLQIDQQGRVTAADATEGAAASDLAGAALQWRFRPFQVDGAAVQVEALVPIRLDRFGVVQHVGLH